MKPCDPATTVCSHSISRRLSRKLALLAMLVIGGRTSLTGAVAGAAIITRRLRGSRSGRASGGLTITRTGVTVGAGVRGPRTKPRLDTAILLSSVAALIVARRRLRG